MMTGRIESKPAPKIALSLTEEECLNLIGVLAIETTNKPSLEDVRKLYLKVCRDYESYKNAVK
jgi:hypothetical protein